MEINVIRCPNCGGDIQLVGNEDTLYCDYCGSLLGIERDAEIPTPVLIHSTGKRSGAYARTGTRSRTTPPHNPILFYVISLMAPIAGFIFAAQHWRAGDETSKRFAKICLMLAILNFVSEGIFILLMVIISLVAGVS